MIFMKNEVTFSNQKVMIFMKNEVMSSSSPSSLSAVTCTSLLSYLLPINITVSVIGVPYFIFNNFLT